MRERTAARLVLLTALTAPLLLVACGSDADAAKSQPLKVTRAHILEEFTFREPYVNQGRTCLDGLGFLISQTYTGGSDTTRVPEWDKYCGPQ